jgi:hypothetical protein
MSLSAVKKIQKEKRGIDKTKEKIPQIAASCGFRFRINKAKTIRKAMSCIFITLCL